MLILTRRVGEAIVIGKNVEVRLLDIDGKQARIGVTAPKETTVNREEVQDRINAGEAVRRA